MKYTATLFATGALALLGFRAQAQVVVDGQLTASELTAGNYVLLGKSTAFTGNQNTGRPFGNNGLLSLYVANTATKVYIFLGGTVETNGNSFQLYMDLPGVTGVPVATFLPGGPAGNSFERVNRIKLEQAADLALALRSDGAPAAGDPQPYKVEAAVYSSATAVQTTTLTSTSARVLGDGTTLTLPAAATGAPYAGLAGARMAYRNTSTGRIAENPGNTSPITGATYGAAGSYGWEIELDRAALGAATGTPGFRIFALQNNDNGGYASGEFIPQTTAAIAAPYPAPNLGGAGNGAGNDVDFTAIADLQTAGFSLGASGALSNRAAAAAVALSVYPNPVQGDATVSYRVQNAQQAVNIELLDLMGRRVSTVFAGQQGAGVQSQKLQSGQVAAGTYLVKVQVGEQVATHKVTLL